MAHFGAEFSNVGATPANERRGEIERLVLAGGADGLGIEIGRDDLARTKEARGQREDAAPRAQIEDGRAAPIPWPSQRLQEHEGSGVFAAAEGEPMGDVEGRGTRLS